jgi:hypothetical protein
MSNHGADPSPRDLYWQSVINAHKSKGKDERTEWASLSRMFRGGAQKNYKDGMNGLHEDDLTKVPSSHAYAFADTLAANVVPTNPGVTVNANRKTLDDAARFRTELSNLVMAKERIGEKLWSMTTRAAIWGRCWMKVAWSPTANRPTYRVVDPHYVWADLNANCVEDMRYVIEVVTLTKEEFQARVKKKGSRQKQFYPNRLADMVEFGKYPDWVEPESNDSGSTTGTAEDIAHEYSQYVTILEVYDFVDNKFYHYADGVPEALFEGELPYTHVRNPFHLLTFNDNMQDLGGMSDAALIKHQVKRMEELDQLEMTHIKTAIPSLVLHEGLVEDIESLMDAIETADGPGLVIPLAAQQGIGINQIMGQTPTVQLPIEWPRSRAAIEANVQFTLGLPSYMRGEVGQTDVATELALTDTATRTRNARRQKVVYRTIEWVSRTTIGLYHQFLEPNSELPLRITDEVDEANVTASMLAFMDGDDVWSWDYQAHPYDQTQNNAVVQLKKLETYLPMLSGNPNVDQRALIAHLLNLMDAPELLAPPPPPQPAAPPMGPGGPQAHPGAAPDLNAMGQPAGNQVMVGDGAQAVPGGMEGGVQPGGGNLEQL